MSINEESFSFQIRLNIDDDPYNIKISSDKVEEQGMILRKHAITFKNAAGVNIFRMETVMENPEIRLAGVGVMEIAQEFMRIVKEAEREGAGCEELKEILARFFPDIKLTIG